MPQSVTPALVGTFAQTVQSGNGMSAQDAQTRNLYGKTQLGTSSNGTVLGRTNSRHSDGVLRCSQSPA